MLNYHKTWRVINSGAGSASYNMAIDEAIAISVRRNDSPPTLRLYSWDRPSVSLGCFQKVRDIDIGYCENTGINIVRRPTGGRAILHNSELTYSFSSKTDNELFSKGILDSYKKISAALHLALSKIGLSPEVKMKKRIPNYSSALCFQATSYGEITINGRKIIGSAQKRWPDGLLQQGSIPYYVDKSSIERIFMINSSQDIKKMTTGLKDIIHDIKDEDFREIIKVAFEETFNIQLNAGSLSQAEEALAVKLELEKYRSSEWNFRR